MVVVVMRVSVVGWWSRWFLWWGEKMNVERTGL